MSPVLVSGWNSCGKTLAAGVELELTASDRIQRSLRIESDTLCKFQLGSPSSFDMLKAFYN